MINTIYKRGRIWWWKYRPNKERGEPSAMSLDTTDKRVAEKRRTERLAEKEREREGILAPKKMREAAKLPILNHLDEFEKDLRARGRASKYVVNLGMRIRKLVEECGWKQLHEISADSFVSWRSRQRFSPKTLLEYQNAISGFLYWLRQNRRITDNPLEFVGKPELRGHETRHRRALTVEEGRRLLEVSGPRAVVYRMVFYTAFRRGELEKLKSTDLHLDDAVEPFVKVRASTTKNHKSAVRYLPPDLAGELRALKVNAAGDTGRVFHVPSVEELHADLKSAGIPPVDAQGRIVDFHALRKTACTWLQIAGISEREAMEFMRHSDRRLTNDVYMDTSLLNVKGASHTLHDLVNGLSQGLHQKLVANSHESASAVIESITAHSEQMPVNIGESHELAETVTTGQDEKWRAQQELNLQPLVP
jgi:integrase